MDRFDSFIETESVSEKIKSLDSKGAYDFLMTKARDAEFELTQSDTEILLEKAFDFISKDENDDVEILNLIEATAHSEWKFEDGKEFLIERLYRALPVLVKRFPTVVDKLESYIGQEYYIRPEISLDVAANLYYDKDSDKHLRNAILPSFNYQYTFGGGRFDAALIKKMDFDNQENFGITAKFLDFYRHLFAQVQGDGYSTDKANDLVVILQSVVESGKGNYLLNIRAESLLKDLSRSSEGRLNSGYDRKPFLLAEGFFAHKKGDDVYVGKSETACDTKLEELNLLEGKNNEEIRDYEFIINPDTRNKIKSDFGLNLSELSINEQFEFLNFLKRKDVVSVENVKSFVHNFGVDGLRLFMLRSISGKDFGDELVNIVDRVGGENAYLIVSKCAKILGEINYFDNSVDSINESKNGAKISNPEVVNKVKEKILEKVFNIFSSFKDKDSADKLIKNLENISAEAVLMQSMVLATRESEGISLNDLPDIDLITKNGSEINEIEREKVREIYRKNYEARPRMLKGLLEGLDKSFDLENADFYTLYFKGELVGTVVFEYDKDQVYFGKFNIDPRFQGGKIGEQLMQETLDRIAETKIVSATCSKGAPVTTKYIERGFVADGEFNFEEDECLNIVRNDSMNGIFKSKSMDEASIINIASMNKWDEFEGGKCRVLLTDYKNMNHLKLPMLSESSETEKWVLTRFFKTKMSNGESSAVIVVERVNKKDYEGYKTKPVLSGSLESDYPLAA